MIKRLRIEEPSIDNWESLTDEERIEKTLTWPQWYQNNFDSKKLRNDFHEYAEAVLSAEDAKKLKSANAFITDLDSAIARILLRGYMLPKFVAYLGEKKFPSLLAIVDGEVSKKDRLAAAIGRPVVTGEVYRPSIQERISEQTCLLLGHVEGEIDDFVTSGCKKVTFDVHSFLKRNDVKGPHSRKILDFLEKNASELKELLKGTDDQLNEGYAFLKKPQQKRFFDFYVEMINSTKSWIDTLKGKRKPRKKKVKSAKDQASKVKYLKEFPELKLISLNPSAVVGARKAWLYNTKDRFAHYLVSDYGLSIKGSTIKDWDSDLSFRKKVRKPDVIVPEIVSAGKVRLKKILPDIRAKEGKITGRLNKDMIILRVEM